MKFKMVKQKEHETIYISRVRLGLGRDQIRFRDSNQLSGPSVRFRVRYLTNYGLEPEFRFRDLINLYFSTPSVK